MESGYSAFFHSLKIKIPLIVVLKSFAVSKANQSDFTFEENSIFME
jgi:hypothetical protein